jgi:hypothetical protein
MKFNKFYAVALFTAALVSCSDDEKGKSEISPEDVNMLISALKVAGTNKDGAPPVPTFTPATPEITNSQASASVTSNNNLYVPFTVNSTSGFSGAYVQLQNPSTGEFSDSYWEIPLNAGAGAGQVVLPIGIPKEVTPGEFIVYYCLYTSSGDVSAVSELSVEVVETQNSCDELGEVYESGEDGLTIRSYTFNTSGTIDLSYEMYSAPDRMDVFVQQDWVGGTGSSLSASETPPASECASPAEGFVSGTGTISIDYKKGQRIDVYLSGCFGGTAWDFWFDCPDSE